MSLRGHWSAGLLVEFHQHATGLHVFGRTPCLPETKGSSVDDTCTAMCEPPAVVLFEGAVLRINVVVAVLSAELHSVGDPHWRLCSHQGIAGVSAVPGHRQLILTNLITDGERRIFSRVPQTVSTLDLHTVTCYYGLTIGTMTFDLGRLRTVPVQGHDNYSQIFR